MDAGRISEGAGGSHPSILDEMKRSYLDKDGCGTNIRGRRRLSRLRIVRVRQGGNPVNSWSESYSVSRASKPPPNWAHRAVFLFVFPETYEAVRTLHRGRETHRAQGRKTARLGSALF